MPNTVEKQCSRNFKISLKTFKLLKKKIVKKVSFKKQNRIKKFSSLTKLDQQRIIKLVSSDPNLYFNFTKIKRKLNLNCSKQTILKFLKHKSYKLFKMQITPYLNESKKKTQRSVC